MPKSKSGDKSFFEEQPTNLSRKSHSISSVNTTSLSDVQIQNPITAAVLK